MKNLIIVRSILVSRKKFWDGLTTLLRSLGLIVKTLLVYIINGTAPILVILKHNLKSLDFTIFKLFSEKVVVVEDGNI